MGAAEKIELDGKDWLTVIEAAHYCGVSNSQFRKYALAYGLTPRKFMGKQLYEKAALYNAIYGSEQWQMSPSIGAVNVPTSTGAQAANGTVAVSAGSAARRLSLYEARKKRS